MDNKTLSIISYLTIIGWLIAFLVDKDKTDDFRKYHLRQSFGLMLISVIYNIALPIIISIIPYFSFLSIVSLLFLVLIIIGIINAANGEKKPLPVIGKTFENNFSFIG